ncbi:MAG: hypothetical protein CG437_473, partial [Methanosaeta sp. NSP1]
MENAGGSLLPWCGWITATNIFCITLIWTLPCPDMPLASFATAMIICRLLAR